MKKNILKITILTLLIILSGCSSISNDQTTNFESPNTIESNSKETLKIEEPTKIIAPINKALSRITKKPFGIKVSPSDSPVSPEKFSGYHAGVDFEIFEEEKDKEVPIYAICTGPMLYKNWVNGYGGVVIQYCELDQKSIAVLYGHMKLSSIQTDENIEAGSQIGILGQGESTETDGERKHLHLGIHKNGEMNLRGYVETEEELKNWINVTEYLK